MRELKEKKNNLGRFIVCHLYAKVFGELITSPGSDQCHGYLFIPVISCKYRAFGVQYHYICPKMFLFSSFPSSLLALVWHQ